MSENDDFVPFVVTLPDSAAKEINRLKNYIEKNGSVGRVFKLTNSFSAKLPNSLLDDLRVNFPSARIDLDDPGELERFGR